MREVCAADPVSVDIKKIRPIQKSKGSQYLRKCEVVTFVNALRFGSGNAI